MLCCLSDGSGPVGWRDGHECWWIQDWFLHCLALVTVHTVAGLRFFLAKVAFSTGRAWVVLSFLSQHYHHATIVVITLVSVAPLCCDHPIVTSILYPPQHSHRYLPANCPTAFTGEALSILTQVCLPSCTRAQSVPVDPSPTFVSQTTPADRSHFPDRRLHSRRALIC